MVRTKQTVANAHMDSRRSTGGKRPKSGPKADINAPVPSIRKPHRFRPGTVALREIRRYQKSTDKALRKAPFERLVRELCDEVKLVDTEFRWSADAIAALHEISEAVLVENLSESYDNTIHAGRETLMCKDIKLMRKRVYGHPGHDQDTKLDFGKLAIGMEKKAVAKKAAAKKAAAAKKEAARLVTVDEAVLDAAIPETNEPESDE